MIIDLAARTGAGAGRCHTDHGPPASPGTVRQWACDAALHPIFTRDPHEILRLGRRTRIISPALRRALAVRDRHGRFPGCDRPAAWCDGHRPRTNRRSSAPVISPLRRLDRGEHLIW